MDNYTATMIVEGVEPVDTEQEYFDAAQHLIDTGLAWSLQGYFGRTCMHLIEEGHCHAKADVPEEADVKLRITNEK